MGISVSAAAKRFDNWIRTEFVELNTELEEIYFHQDDKADVEGSGTEIKEKLVGQGRALIGLLLKEGNTQKDFHSVFNTLGNVGLFLASLRRHELTNDDRDDECPFEECSALAQQISADLGVAPRFVSAHLSTYNFAVNGVQKSFTSLQDEKLFHDYNLYAILFYKRAAEALMHIPSMGISASATALMLKEAKAALNQVTLHNKALFDSLDTARFFFCVRPYFKTYYVGSETYRGANAGDFSGVNQIDLLLGLCRANDPFYARLLEEKMLFMVPEDQRLLRMCLEKRPLLDEFLGAENVSAKEPWFIENCQLFLDVCRTHGQSAGQHHNMLVNKYIEKPSESVEKKHLKQITASGPPLPDLLKSLARLRDLRMAAAREDIDTAHNDLMALQTSLQ